VTSQPLLASERVFQGRTIGVTRDRVLLPNGFEVELDIVRHPGATAVVPLLADGNVILVRQYRHATGGWLLEIPAGKLGPGEEAEVGARRELAEETGSTGGTLHPLGFVWMTPGFCDERIWLYLATGIAEGQQHLEPDEALELVRLPLAEAVRRARDGEIFDAKSTCALLRADALLQRGLPGHER
jgi:ADP-ribose pyrophosphatase